MFAPHQIVRLECDQTQLYAEVIQVLESRQICWVRPRMLVYGTYPQGHGYLLEANNSMGIQPVIDGPDLLWPSNQFHLALDTEVIPLLALLQNHKPAGLAPPQTTNRLLRQFIEKLWTQQTQVREA